MKKADKYNYNPSIQQINLKVGVKLIFPQEQKNTSYSVNIENLDTGNEVEKAITIATKKKIEKEAFVKIFESGFVALSKIQEASQLFFSYIVPAISREIGKDQIYLSYDDYANRCKEQKSEKVSERTYFNSMKKILAEKLLYKSTSTNIYFINIACVFNGDRLKFITDHIQKEKAAKVEP